VIELILTKYSRQGAQGIIEDGFCERRDAIQKVAAQFGETLVGYWATDNGEWDSVAILEASDDNPAGSVATNLRGVASGSVERFRRFRLYTPEQADADLGVAAEARWAGQDRSST
jgi:uncharacterized protein with GYD domain